MSIIKNYVYTGLVYPIELHDVETRNVYGEEQAIIDVKKVSDTAIQSLSKQQDAFTGNQLIFIRSYFQKNYSELAKAIKCSEKDLIQWEKLDNNPIKMNSTVKETLQQYIQSEIIAKNENTSFKQKNVALSEKNLFSQEKKSDSSPDNKSDKKRNDPDDKKFKK